MIIEAALEYIVTKIGDEIYDRVRQRLSDPFDAVTGRLISSLDRLEARADQQMLAPLRAGMTFLRLSDPDSAVREFIRAEATDPDSPVSKWWLGLTLLLVGRAEGRGYLRQALERNPRIPLALLPASNATLPNFSTATTAWEMSLPVALAKSIPKQKVPFDEEIPQRESAAVRALSVGGKILVVDWIMGGCLRVESRPETVLSAIEPGTGHIMWYLVGREYGLLFTSQRYVAVRDGRDKDAPRLLLDPRTGATMRSLTSDYFDVAFNATWLSAQSQPAPWEVTAMEVGDALARTTVKRPPKSWLGRLLSFPNEHDYVELAESISVIGDDGILVKAVNHWNHCHFLFPPPPRAPVCALWSEATMAASPANTALQPTGSASG